MNETTKKILPGTTWRERQFFLLRAIRDICEEREITMLLAGETALSAYRDGMLNDNPAICIDMRDVNRFEQAMRLLANSGVIYESMTTTPFFPHFEGRVIDENSIDFDAKTQGVYRCGGLSVRVFFIAHVPDNEDAAKSASSLKAAYERYVNRHRRTGKSFPHPRLVKRIGPSAFFPQLASRSAFHALAKRYSGKTAFVAIGGTTLPPKLLDKTRTVSVGGIEFPIPADIETYLEASYGKEWHARKIRTYKETNSRFRDATHAWRDFATRIGHIDFRSLAEDKARYTELSRDFKAYHERIAPYVGYLKRTHYHFTLQEEYRDRIGDLRLLLDEGKTDQLAEQLQDYLDKLEECREAGLGLVPDPELFDIALAYLHATDRHDYADELMKLVDSESRKTTKLGQ